MNNSNNNTADSNAIILLNYNDSECISNKDIINLLTCILPADIVLTMFIDSYDHYNRGNILDLSCAYKITNNY